MPESTGFDSLHPAVQHHVVNTLGWRTLRPLQEAAVPPVLGGSHALLVAPTAGGKTEAAVFPLFSRMLTEEWRGLSTLYLCPIRALLNDLEPRLERFAMLLGRRVGLWHGDVGPTARKRLIESPPDVLLTTPESLEAMLIFRREDRAALFRNLRAVVVDELHAFAGDFRGWHLLAVLERLSRIAGRELQRVGLSATVGNPDAILTWFVGTSAVPRVVVSPPSPPSAAPDVQLDFVGSLQNAAVVISRLHRGEKRLVFLDSRSRVEDLAVQLRGQGVTTFVSHGSLGLEERRQAESAFHEARDCVIVATSTLELGIDVGDLDRVIQVDAPSTVASFLQRLGRTGRRAGSTRNCLFLATSEAALLQSAGILDLWSQGWVEPVEPPSTPLHLFAQQLLALVLQEGAVGRNTWSEWLDPFCRQAGLAAEDLRAVVEHMVQTTLLFQDDGGLLTFGAEGEASFGRNNFLELCSIFTSAPLFKILHGRTEVGSVHERTFQVETGEKPILLLAGRAWEVQSLDWRRRTAQVTPTEGSGRSRWESSSRSLHFRLCRAMRRVLAASGPPRGATKRAVERLEELRTAKVWCAEDATALVRDGDQLRWWTFAGRQANQTLAHHLGDLADGLSRADNLSVRLRSQVTPEALAEAVTALRTRGALLPPVSPAALDGLKFSECLPPAIGQRLLERWTSDPTGVAACLSEPIRTVVESTT